jgi:hypothetical protein
MGEMNAAPNRDPFAFLFELPRHYCTAHSGCGAVAQKTLPPMR